MKITLAVLGWFLVAATALLAAEYFGPVFPADNIWNMPVDDLPVDPNSTAYINTIGRNTGLHPDFGSGLWQGAPIGIPYVTIPGTQPGVGISFYYPGESDPGPYPIPPNPPIEGGPNSTGDRHILVIDTDHEILYEVYDAYPDGHGGWSAGSGAIFDLNSNDLRPAGWTSADAAGLPIFAGLVRYEEVAAGEIRHAIRFTAPQTRKAYVWPARHHASDLTGAQYPPMGQRFRLKSGFDVSGFGPQTQVILQAMKTYGIILADNGSSWYITGVPDSRWDDDQLHELGSVHGSDFEAVDVSSLMVHPDSGAAAAPDPLLTSIDLPLSFPDRWVYIQTWDHTAQRYLSFAGNGAQWAPESVTIPIRNNRWHLISIWDYTLRQWVHNSWYARFGN